MAAPAICVGFPLLMWGMAGQAFVVLTMPGMAGLAVENRMVAGEVAHGCGGLIMAGDAGRCRPCHIAVVDLLRSVWGVTLLAAGYGEMFHPGRRVTLITGGDGVCPTWGMLPVAVDAGNTAAMTFALSFDGAALIPVAFAAILRLKLRNVLSFCCVGKCSH